MEDGFLVLEVPEGGLHGLIEFVIVSLDLGLPVLYRVLEKRRFSLNAALTKIRPVFYRALYVSLYCLAGIRIRIRSGTRFSPRSGSGSRELNRCGSMLATQEVEFLHY
jgi:hypothetical protein